MEFKLDLLIKFRRHPRIAQFIALCTKLPPIIGDNPLIMNYYLKGSLYHMLHGLNALQNEPLKEKVRIALEIAEGMVFLHLHNVLHRDFKSLNILMDDNNHVRITDFGLSKQVPENMPHVSNMSATLIVDCSRDIQRFKVS
jgi:serine/threonine protein kinase